MLEVLALITKECGSAVKEISMASKLRMGSNLFLLELELTSVTDSSAIEHLFISGVILLCLCLVLMWRSRPVFVLAEYLQTSHLNNFFTCQSSGVGFFLLFNNI